MAEQDFRIGKLKLSGGIELKLVRFTGNEALSELFVFHADGWSEKKGDIDFEPAIGKPATISIETGGKERFFCGLLTETATTTDTAQGFMYHLVIRPHMHMLTKKISSRIFDPDTVNNIVAKVFGEHGLNFDDKTTRSYPKLDYCVQYRESDFEFVSRLLEAHGISYHHSFPAENTHQLLLCDRDREPMPGPTGKTRKFLLGEYMIREEESLSGWSALRSHTIGKVTTNDYDFIKPTANYQNSVETDASYGHAKLEDYVPLYHHHLADTIKAEEGKNYAQYRLDSHRSRDYNYTADGDSPSFAPGYLMTLEDHPTDNGDYVVVRSLHTLTMQGYRSETGASAFYKGTYTLFPSDSNKPWTPPMTTRRPQVAGIETAVVVGESEIDVDEYGRILVQFHWNEKSKKHDSMRARVAQMWAGSLWGTQYIPRKGMEVIVTHIDGDPDRPLVIGSVYNKDNMPPYAMPGEKNISGIKSHSTEKASGYNEIAFDDTKGAELVRMHAQKNYETKILWDEKREIKHDRTTTIDNNDTLTVEKDILIEAKNSITLKVGKSTIVMDKTMMSIEVNSPNVKVMAVQNLETTGTIMTKHSSGGPMMINGVVVKIN